MIKKLALISLFNLAVTTQLIFAQEAKMIPEVETFEKAKVVEILNQEKNQSMDGNGTEKTQTIKAEIISGKKTGEEIIFKNDYVQLKVGEIFYARHQSSHLNEIGYWSVAEPYRLDTLLILTITFVLLIFIFGGIQGVRGLASLIGSLFIIFYLLIPGVYAGHNTVLVSIGVASLIIIAGSYITHGFNRTTSSAVISMIITVTITGLAAYYVIAYSANLSGYSSEEVAYLAFDTRGVINVVGLLFGGIMIGLLGVLYDIAIGQAVAVEELFRAGKHLTRKEVYKRGIRIGREHIGALVNTLAIAYVGASLPLLLLIQSSTVGTLFILNSEVFATEIVRILIGSIGLILAVPITTLISSYMLYGKVSDSETTHKHRH